jgi:hypothetical protein
MFGPVRPWDNSNDATGENLRQVWHKTLFKCDGSVWIYDGACDYFNAKYNLWQMDPSGKLKDRMSWKGYRWPYDVFKKTGFRNCK